MDLDFSEEGKVKVTMIPYIKDILEDFPEEVNKTAATPASDNLFKVRDHEDPKKRELPEEQAVAFHQAFLTTCVKSPDKDDWGKL